ncbi:hypothetical protein V8F33_009152 [Rhypophila sp. PSN 637]
MLSVFLSLVILSNLPIAISQSPECGSLITFRQFDELLDSAPSCLKSGCQTSAHQVFKLTMTSSCPSPSPCHALWDLLRLEWQENWCGTCSQDIACRIAGWPILNSTSACAKSPNEWLFSNSAGGCCANGQEPFELAAWTGVLCNGSEWRAPFNFYGGMAKNDWVEWLQPWNWTVHLQNETDRNFTQVSCDSAKAISIAFAADNFVSAGWAALELFGYWLCCICAWNVVMTEVHTMRRSLVAGLITGGLYLVSNFATSIMWNLRPGYSHIPRGFVGLLLCSRPSILGFLSLISIWGRGRVARTIPTGVEALREQREASWLNKARVKEWRRAFGNFLRKFERGERRNRQVTDEDLADGKETAKQLLAGFALTIGVSELVIQVASAYSIFKTATVGGSRGFFSRDALVPFYEGYSASLMYAGSRNTENDDDISTLTIEDGADSKGTTTTDRWDQRAFEHALIRRQRPGFWKRTWIRVKGVFSPGLPAIPPTPPLPSERGSLHNIRVKLILAITRPLNNLIEEANAAPGPTDIEAGETNTNGERQIPRRIRRLAGLALSVPFLRNRITRSFTSASEEDTRRRTERPEEERGPNMVRFNELVARHEENLRVEDEMRRTRPTRRSPAFLFTFFFVSINYASQWLFWAGFVETAGEKWCPPDEEFNIEKGIWGAIAAVALLVSVILSSSTDPGPAATA